MNEINTIEHTMMELKGYSAVGKCWPSSNFPFVIVLGYELNFL